MLQGGDGAHMHGFAVQIQLEGIACQHERRHEQHDVKVAVGHVDDDAQQQSQRNGGDDVGQQAADILAHQRAELAHAAYLVIQDEQRQVDKDAQCGEQQGKAKGGQRGQVIRHARQ